MTTNYDSMSIFTKNGHCDVIKTSYLQTTSFENLKWCFGFSDEFPIGGSKRAQVCDFW